METVYHKASSRGHADHGWLNTYHTFSFASYYDPERIHFGVLRVLNDDMVAPGKGFGKHPHDNMEIITIPLEGALEHKDSMGNSFVINKNEIQVMSAGTGIYHSEFNHSKTEEVKLLQIWVYPRSRDVEPRYDQIAIDPKQAKNKLLQVVSPNKDDEGTWIYQDAWFHLGQFSGGSSLSYQVKKEGNGLYCFLIEGSVNIAGQNMESKDGLGVKNTDSVHIEVKKDSHLLVMDIPMNI